MTSDDNPLRAWAVQALEREMKRQSPAAKLKRELVSDNARTKKKYKQAMRAISSKQAAVTRKVRQAQVEREAELERRRWDLLIGG